MEALDCDPGDAEPEPHLLVLPTDVLHLLAHTLPPYDVASIRATNRALAAVGNCRLQHLCIDAESLPFSLLQWGKQPSRSSCTLNTVQLNAAAGKSAAASGTNAGGDTWAHREATAFKAVESLCFNGMVHLTSINESVPLTLADARAAAAAAFDAAQRQKDVPHVLIAGGAPGTWADTATSSVDNSGGCLAADLVQAAPPVTAVITSCDMQGDTDGPSGSTASGDGRHGHSRPRKSSIVYSSGTASLQSASSTTQSALKSALQTSACNSRGHAGQAWPPASSTMLHFLCRFGVGMTSLTHLSLACDLFTAIMLGQACSASGVSHQLQLLSLTIVSKTDLENMYSQYGLGNPTLVPPPVTPGLHDVVDSFEQLPRLAHLKLQGEVLHGEALSHLHLGQLQSACIQCESSSGLNRLSSVTRLEIKGEAELVEQEWSSGLSALRHLRCLSLSGVNSLKLVTTMPSEEAAMTAHVAVLQQLTALRHSGLDLNPAMWLMMAPGLHKIVNLHLSFCCLRRQHMSALGLMPCLRQLRVWTIVGEAAPFQVALPQIHCMCADELSAAAVRWLLRCMTRLRMLHHVQRHEVSGFGPWDAPAVPDACLDDPDDEAGDDSGAPPAWPDSTRSAGRSSGGHNDSSGAGTQGQHRQASAGGHADPSTATASASTAGLPSSSTPTLVPPRQSSTHNGQSGASTAAPIVPTQNRLLFFNGAAAATPLYTHSLQQLRWPMKSLSPAVLGEVQWIRRLDIGGVCLTNSNIATFSSSLSVLQHLRHLGLHGAWPSDEPCMPMSAKTACSANELRSLLARKIHGWHEGSSGWVGSGSYGGSWGRARPWRQQVGGAFPLASAEVDTDHSATAAGTVPIISKLMQEVFEEVFMDPVKLASMRATQADTSSAEKCRKAGCALQGFLLACPYLTHLTLQRLDELTDLAIEIASGAGALRLLRVVRLEECDGVGEQALRLLAGGAAMQAVHVHGCLGMSWAAACAVERECAAAFEMAQTAVGEDSDASSTRRCVRVDWQACAQ